MSRKSIILVAILLTTGASLYLWQGNLSAAPPVPVKEAQIEPLDDPGAMEQKYPSQYAGWKATAQPTESGKSRYKRGYDSDGVVYDKMDQYPFLALLLSGSGYALEFNEPRGHAYMIEDQLEVEPARLKAGGSCLTCKTPYAPQLQEKLGDNYFGLPYKDVLSRIPEEHRTLGVTCGDCHGTDMELRISRAFTLGKGLEALGKKPDELKTAEMRTLVCAQCHVTYNIPQNDKHKSEDVVFPWQGSEWGDISAENIISRIRKNAHLNEWTQNVTGFRLGYIRHPEFEFFSNDSTHWQAGAACADCHMPATEVDGKMISDHRVMSPLKSDLRGCAQCHEDNAETLRQKVFVIQDQTVSVLIRSGYATAAVAKLFEKTHAEQKSGLKVNPDLYAQAREHYEEAFYRVLFMAVENSVGFHNPTEASRILKDAMGHAATADHLLRRALEQAGLEVATEIDLELEKYLNNRGEKKRMFRPEHEIKDPLPVVQESERKSDFPVL
ncbi:MAG: ammonia-forming cytochrome c nitrite reductase subunit c552 [Desulfuromonadales bacterium]|nr:ammonia-forming cytochrome c nitrite reductase subunit c552 [Desulfuromonadales bacterium]